MLDKNDLELADCSYLWIYNYNKGLIWSNFMMTHFALTKLLRECTGRAHIFKKMSQVPLTAKKP